MQPREGVMAFCNFCDRCFFFNELLLDILLSDAEDLRRKYCVRHFRECALYKLATSCGIEKVPGYICPDDSIENLKTPLTKFSSQGEKDMFIKVIYPDGTAGKIRSSFLGSMMQMGRIVAYRCSEGWVETRRTSGARNYLGPERRVIIPFS
jgi:hypothetical protein